MEENSVNTMREASRYTLQLNRRFHRDELSDTRRSVHKVDITSKTIEDIANRLKTKSPVSVHELQILKNGLLADEKNIVIVLNTHGALRGLVRELTGSEVKKQCAAAGCFCNLGLADSKGCTAVAKAAGPYLVTALDSLTTELVVTCAWALGNLAGSGCAASDILEAQGALPKLCNMLLSTNEEIKDAAVYSLVHFAYQMKDRLSAEHFNKIAEALLESEISTASCQLLFILSCHQEFNKGLHDNHLQRLLSELPTSMHFHSNKCSITCSKDCKLLNLLRILANINIEQTIYNTFMHCFSQIINQFKLILIEDNSLSISALWLLGNVYNFRGDSEFFNELLK